jgi:hypothetical protein
VGPCVDDIDDSSEGISFAHRRLPDQCGDESIPRLLLLLLLLMQEHWWHSAPARLECTAAH